MDLLGRLFDIARQRRRTIVLPEGDDERIVEAALRLKNENIAKPILLGATSAPVGITTINPRSDARLASYGAALSTTRDSMTSALATRLATKPLYFGGMMVRQGDADAMVAGCANPT